MTRVFTKFLCELTILGNAAFETPVDISVVEMFSTPYILRIIALILVLTLWFSQWWYSDRTAAVNVHIVPVHLHRRASVNPVLEEIEQLCGIGVVCAYECVSICGMIVWVSATKLSLKKIFSWNFALTMELQGFNDCILDVCLMATDLVRLQNVRLCVHLGCTHNMYNLLSTFCNCWHPATLAERMHRL